MFRGEKRYRGRGLKMAESKRRMGVKGKEKEQRGEDRRQTAALPPEPWLSGPPLNFQ